MQTLPPSVQTKINKKIEKYNDLFKNTTAAQKRILIAKDVLEQIRIGRIKAETGNYANIDTSLSEIEIGNTKEDVRQCILIPGTECVCCGIGSLMISTILFRDNLKKSFDFDQLYLNDTRGVEDGTKVKSGDNGMTLRIFGKSQLDLIEIAFEVWGAVQAEDSMSRPKSYIKTPELAQKAYDFGKSYVNEKDRLKAIMQNIVKNNGTFVP